MINNLENEKMLAAKAAIKLLKDDIIVGLGIGSTSFYVIKEIGELVRNGLKIKAIATSNETKAYAKSLDTPLVDINTVNSIDITIDGADEFNSDLVLIKGGGGALLKEKIVASLTKQEIIIVDSSKKVDLIGKFKIPIEVIPFASNYVLARIVLIDGLGEIRRSKDIPFITDQGNYIIDADFGLISNPLDLSKKLNEIEGLVAHGIFIGLATKVIMGKDDATIIFE
ncbi:ribose-5-phosphate isomerase RpiA [Flavobacterium sp. Root186]|uniref:ribose-5-phosphate isomerase RpiA n=1 Tax=Flavobacterium sp. Root186 TaxID=1736485 RepID=UPI0018FE0968|nr:ribose-5-phosphate isomerase RpiA [Flavobacterium sp. Root186]